MTLSAVGLVGACRRETDTLQSVVLSLRRSACLAADDRKVEDIFNIARELRMAVVGMLLVTGRSQPGKGKDAAGEKAPTKGFERI